VSGFAQSILPQELLLLHDAAENEAVPLWLAKSMSVLPKGEKKDSQKEWESPLTARLQNELLGLATTPQHSASGLESGALLNAVPASALGTLLDNDSFRVAVSLRLGTNLCLPHTCICGQLVDETGTHGLCCRFSAGRRSRHAAVNDILQRALVSAGVPAVLEPVGTSRDDGKRPDGVTLVPWEKGKPLVWDFTCADNLAPSHLSSSSTTAGSTALDAERKKRNKYLSLSEQFIFHPVATETMGMWGPEASRLVRQIGQRITTLTGETRATTFLIQSISIAIQRGNAASVLGTLPRGRGLKELYFI
jgi:hypothetical protein